MPRRLAAGRRETAEDRVAFLEVIEQADLAWKEAAHAIGNVLQCWEHQGTTGAILEYDGFATPATEAVLECMAGLDTTSRRLTDYRIDDDRDVAAVVEVLPPEKDENIYGQKMEGEAVRVEFPSSLDRGPGDWREFHPALLSSYCYDQNVKLYSFRRESLKFAENPYMPGVPSSRSAATIRT